MPSWRSGPRTGRAFPGTTDRPARAPWRRPERARLPAPRALAHHPDGQGWRGPGPARAVPGLGRAQPHGVFRRPHQGRVAVVHGGGEPVHRGKPVVDGHHHGAHGHRDRTAHPVGQAQVTEDKPATVEVQDQRPRARAAAGWPVDPHRDVPGRPGHGPVGNLGPGHDRPENAVGDRVARGVAGLHGDDLGLGLRADRALALHQPRPQPHPVIDRRHPRSVPCRRVPATPFLPRGRRRTGGARA